jgi:ribosomal-protein-alanine N-acetyltransferase
MGGVRVRLREPRSTDRAEYLSLNRRSRRLYGRWATPPTTPRAFATPIARNRRPDNVCFLICRHSDGAILGAVELSQIARGRFRSAYLGFHIGVPYARHGTMREALALLLRHCFARLRPHRVEANVQPDTRASRALVRQLGFVREGYSGRCQKIAGRWRDHERWALLVDDWRAAGRRRG